MGVEGLRWRQADSEVAYCEIKFGFGSCRIAGMMGGNLPLGPGDLSVGVCSVFAWNPETISNLEALRPL